MWNEAMEPFGLQSPTFLRGLIELSNGVESRQPVWDGHGNDEDFLCHMLGTREAMEDMG